MIYISRICIACRRLLPEDLAERVLTFTWMDVKWNKKQNKHSAKPAQEDVYALCETCAEKMEGLLKSQQEKGIKVL